MGRNSKLTKTVQDDICTALSLMHTYESAAGYARVGISTLSLWRSQGRDAREKHGRGEELTPEETKKLNFLAAVEQAEAEAVFNLHQVVIEGAKVDPNLALRLLQIRRPQDYAPPAVRAEVSGKDGGPVVHEHKGQTHGDVDHLAAVLATLVGVGAVALPDATAGVDATDDELHPA